MNWSRKAAFLAMSLLSAIPLCADEPVKIGVLTDLSGPASYYGNQTRVGALLANKELKDEGKKVQVIVEDSALSTARGLSAAQKLLFVDKVDALYVDFTAVAAAVSTVARQQKKLLVYASAAESILKDNPYAYKVFLDFRLGCEALAREFLKDGMKKLGALKYEAEFGEACLEGMKAAANPVVFSYRQGESVSSQVLALKQKGVDAIINVGYEGDILNMLKAARDLSYRPRFGGAQDGFTDGLQQSFSKELRGSLGFRLPRVPETIIYQAQSIPGGPDLRDFQRVGITQLHLNQILSAEEACKPDKLIACVMAELDKSPASPEIGFEGWKDRKAGMRLVLTEFTEKGTQEIGSYTLGTRRER